MPPSSSGGIVLIETLGILSARYPDAAALTKLGRNSSAYLHVLAEAFKHGFADRARQLGDTDFVTVDLAHLSSAAYHRELAARIKDDARAAARQLRHAGRAGRPCTATAAPPTCASSTPRATRCR